MVLSFPSTKLQLSLPLHRTAEVPAERAISRQRAECDLGAGGQIDVTGAAAVAAAMPGGVEMIWPLPFSPPLRRPHRAGCFRSVER